MDRVRRPHCELLAVLFLTTQLIMVDILSADEKVVVKQGSEIVLAFTHHAYRSKKEIDLASIAKANSLEVIQTSPHGLVVMGAPELRRLGVHSSEKAFMMDRAPLDEICAQVRKVHPDVICEPNYQYSAAIEPNDPQYSSSWGLDKINAPRAWDITRGSRRVKVAVLDTGVDYRHSDLVGNIAVNTKEVLGNGRDEEHNGYPDDYYGWDFIDNDAEPLDLNGHGTRVAGVVGAMGNNNIGMTGVNWVVGLIPIRVLNEHAEGYLSDVAQGIEYALDREAVILNLSLTGPERSEIFEEALQEARRQNVLVVVAAGNYGSNNDLVPSYPASYTVSNLISVAATDNTDLLWSLSNYGKSSVTVAAPGVSIESTLPDNSYGSASGTSLASPYVAGTAALLKSRTPSLDAAAIKKRLIGTVDSVSGLEFFVSSKGRLNAARAVSMVMTLRLTGKQRRTVKIEGRLFGSTDNVGLAGIGVVLRCEGKASGRTTTGENGQILFAKVRRRPTAQVCYAQADSLSLKSRNLRISKSAD